MQCRRSGGAGGRAPYLSLLKILFLEHHVMTIRQQTMMEIQE